ncbi:MAG TPA: hypothetical protein VH143_01620 [Kofleriaceae bacterium]|jgi:hypothetical protein|nr:hypothetical protein [Kofleriaceae bacterium]
MRSALALTLATMLFGGGCFPHSARNRAIAEIAEGAVLVGGVVLESTVTTTADCQADLAPPPNCGANGTRNGAIGVGMILTSLVAFIATISSAEEQGNEPLVTITPKPSVRPPMAPPLPAPAPAPMPPTEPAPTGSAASLMSF